MHRCGFASVLAMLLVGLSGELAAAPPAGAEIANQASVTYQDANGLARRTTTNQVVVLIRQIYAAQLSADQILFAAPSQDVRFRHTLVNLGNGTDRYTVTVAQDNSIGVDSGDFSTIKVYHDQNSNGQVDAGEPVLADATGLSSALGLAAGQDARLIVQARIPPMAIAPQGFGLTLTVQAHEGSGAPVADSVVDTSTNQGNDGLNDTNEDFASVTTNAVLEISKSSLYLPGLASTSDDDKIRYTVTVKNFGVGNATDISVVDELPPGTTFDSGVGVSSSDAAAWDFPVAGADDGFNGQPGSLPTESGGVLTGEIDFLGTGAAADFSYEVNLVDGVAGGTVFRNVAQAQGNLDNILLTTEDAFFSNETRDVVPGLFGVLITDTGLSPGPGLNDGGDDDAANDRQFVDVVANGASVIFTNVVRNGGNQDDRYNLVVESQNYPSGTLFRFYAEDGVTPLLDTTGDGIVDTGLMNPGALRIIVVRAFLPPGSSGPGPFDAVVVASSTADPGTSPASDSVTERLGAIAPPVVDLANRLDATGFNDAGAVDADPAASITTTLTARSGGSVEFPLFLANEGGLPDSYALSASADAANTVALPEGWQVEFLDAQDNLIANTPSIPPGTSFAFFGRITIPSGPVSAALWPVFFHVRSAISGATDSKQDALSFDREAIELSDDQAGIVQACGSRVYRHTLRNAGDTTESIRLAISSATGFNSQLLLATGSQAGEFTDFVGIEQLLVGQNTAVYDLSAASFVQRPLLDDGAGGVALLLDAGDSTVVVVQVAADCNVGDGQVGTVVLTAEVLQGSARASNTDVTTVSRTQLTISKFGAADLDCNGEAEGDFLSANVQALPGQCVIWQLIAVNNGVDGVCNVRISDSAPPFSSLNGVAGIVAEPAPGAGVCNTSPPAISCRVGNVLDADGDGDTEAFCLLPGESAEVRFGVRVD